MNLICVWNFVVPCSRGSMGRFQLSTRAMPVAALVMMVACIRSSAALRLSSLQIDGVEFCLDDKTRGRKEHCGIVMMSFGRGYSEVAMKAAARTRGLKAQRGWCPLDPALDYIPVTLFTDMPKATFSHCRPGWPRGRPHQPANVEVHPEEELGMWTGPPVGSKFDRLLDSDSHMRHLGSWKVRWYHAESILHSPYTMTMYLDVDAYPCSAESISQLMWALPKNGAAVGNPAYKAVTCQASGGNCSDPHPPDLRPGEAAAWSRFHERNAGVLVADLRRARPLLEDFARGIRRTAGSGRVTGDQYALREALFKHRRGVPQMTFPEEDICRWKHSGRCERKGRKGCAIHHFPGGESLRLYGMVRDDSGDFAPG